MRRVCRPADAWPTIPRRSRCTIAARFWATAIRSANLVAGCRKLGMNVIARTDPHAAHQDVYDAHPDWIAVDAEGRKRKHWADPELWVTCALGPYNFEFMTDVTREIMSLYKVDGIFSNRWAGSGMCYCEHCQENFRKFSGLDLPRTRTRRIRRGGSTSCGIRSGCSNSGACGMARSRRSIPMRVISPTPAAGALSDLDMKTIGELAPTLFADRQARRGLMPPWIERQERERVRRDARQQGDRRHLQHGRGGAVPLEGLGAERRRDPAVGGGRGRA